MVCTKLAEACNSEAKWEGICKVVCTGSMLSTLIPTLWTHSSLDNILAYRYNARAIKTEFFQVPHQREGN